MASTSPLTLATDGASRGNPGPAAIAYALFDEHDERLNQDAATIGAATNNEAEYEALLAGLEAAAKVTAGPLVHLSDSQLVVRQLNGEYKIRADRLARKARKARRLADRFERVEHRHVPRRHPRIDAVDELANQALDRQEDEE